MEFTRRDTLALGVGAAALTVLPLKAMADAVETDIAAFTNGAEIGEGGVTVTAPEIAENGNTVPITVSAPGATAIIFIPAGNPDPTGVIFNFGELAGSQTVSTRVRLSSTQDVIAIARMADGSYSKATANVKVTIGGCGG